MGNTKQERDRAVLEEIARQNEFEEWANLGRRGRRYVTAIDKGIPDAPEASLKRLVEAGLVVVRTASYAYWGSWDVRQRWLEEEGVQNLSDLNPLQLKRFQERFYDRVRIEAKLTDKGRVELGAATQGRTGIGTCEQATHG